MIHTQVDVTGVGANSMDCVAVLGVDFATVQSIGKAETTEFRSFCGGQTATTLAACAAFGLSTRYIGAFGSDQRGTDIRRELERRGVDVGASARREAPNAGALIMVAKTGERTVIFTRDPRLRLSSRDLDRDIIGSSRLIHVDDVEPEAALETARTARERGVPVTSDLEQVNDRTEQLIAAVSYPILERRVPEALTGERDPERALRKLRRLNAGVLCVTLAEGGAAALEDDEFHLAPAIDVAVVDTTGAGDVFRAGWIYGVLQGWRTPDVLRFANAAAALSCTRLGAMASVPSLDEVSAFYRPAGEARRD